MGRRPQLLFLLLISTITFLAGGRAGTAAPDLNHSAYLPLISQQRPVEFRGLWITRFEWAIGHNPSPGDIDRIVENAAAGFNALLFQVRGTADAYYDSRVEPWAVALAGSLGTDPGWDPLARLIAGAQARGLQVHAYVNVYPVWPRADSPPPVTEPLHLYHRLAAVHGVAADGRLHGLQWNRAYEIPAEYYLRATPASFEADRQLLAVVRDLVTRYNIDGIHLDHIRYGGPSNSCDPVTEARIGGPCFAAPPAGYPSFEAWQRAQVNGTVNAVYESLFAPDEAGHTLAPPDFRLSAAVWPFYESGYHNFYQDSKAWLAGGYIDALMPMLYGSIDNPEYYDDPLAKWQELAAGFQAANAGRHVIPGLHGNFDSFAEIAGRIAAARELGTAGHAIFSYSYLAAHNYFDDLAAGPYREPAVPPRPTWHPQ